MKGSSGQGKEMAGARLKIIKDSGRKMIMMGGADSLLIKCSIKDISCRVGTMETEYT